MLLNFPTQLIVVVLTHGEYPAGRGELPTSNLGNGATRSIGEPSYCCCFKESLWQCRREWQRQRESVRKAKAEEHRSTWWWQKMKKMQGGDGWRKKATHSYVELSYKKTELLAKNHVRIRLPARAYAAICGTFAVLTRHAPIP